MPFSIMHLSDLHRSPSDPISNDELISALVSDRDRYIRETPRVTAPEAIVVSGDLIQGVPLGTADYGNKLAQQYAVASECLDELVRRFLNGDRSRVVIVPGNHDVDWNTAFSAMAAVRPEDMPRDLVVSLQSQDTSYRWDWKSLTLYRVTDPGLYAQRLDSFWMFFRSFYDGVSGLLKVEPGSDANLFALCDDRIAVAAYNSCHGNDCFAPTGMIRKDVVARSHLELNDTGKIFDLRMAVWHHSVEGPPQRTDYMDAEVVRGMIGRGFRLGLYGHQHRAQVTPHQVWLPDRERMAVVSAGSLCAGARELPIGATRQYNIVEIADDARSVRVHVRAMSVANLFARGQLLDLGGVSHVDLNWEPPKNLVGGPLDTGRERVNSIIQEAELAAKSGAPARAIELMRKMDLAAGSYERKLFLSASAEAQDWASIIRVTDPPSSIGELVYRVEALLQVGKVTDAGEALEKYSLQLQIAAPLLVELRRRIKAHEVLAQ